MNNFNHKLSHSFTNYRMHIKLFQNACNSWRAFLVSSLGARNLVYSVKVKCSNVSYNTRTLFACRLGRAAEGDPEAGDRRALRVAVALLGSHEAHPHSTFSLHVSSQLAIFEPSSTFARIRPAKGRTWISSGDRLGNHRLTLLYTLQLHLQ